MNTMEAGCLPILRLNKLGVGLLENCPGVLRIFEAMKHIFRFAMYDVIFRIFK